MCLKYSKELIYVLTNILLLYFFLGNDIFNQILNIQEYYDRPYASNTTIGELKEYAQVTEGDQAIHEIDEEIQPYGLDDNQDVNLLNYYNIAEQVDDSQVHEETFKTFDSDGDGLITANDVVNFMRSCGYPNFNIDEAIKMIKEATNGEKNEINREEFENFIINMFK